MFKLIDLFRFLYLKTKVRKKVYYTGLQWGKLIYLLNSFTCFVKVKQKFQSIRDGETKVQACWTRQFSELNAAGNSLFDFSKEFRERFCFCRNRVVDDQFDAVAEP